MKSLVKRSSPVLLIAALLATFNVAVSAATFTFDADPFQGTTALTTPGRQIVGDELFTPFSIASDVFVFDSVIFPVGSLNVANGLVENLPTSGPNVVVLQTFDNDGNIATPFLAGTAANLIANQITSAGPGFFIYFNSNLDLPRLVFSTDLSDNTADLKVLARLTNLTGEDGRNAMPTFTSANFQVTAVPDSVSNLIYLMATGALVACRYAFARGSRSQS